MSVGAPVQVELLGQLIPGRAAAGVHCLHSNNNLDWILHDGRVHLVWRTAPSHFASPDVRLEITSTGPIDHEMDDAIANVVRDSGTTWRHDATIALGADVREPRFVVHEGRLHLIWFELGVERLKFQPRRVWLSVLDDSGWSDPEVIIDEPIVPWRIRRWSDDSDVERWVMFDYRGAEQMYGPRPADPTIEIRWSDDLRTWSDPQDVHVGGCEMDLVVLADGRIAGVTRNEGPSRHGSDIVIGPSFDRLSSTPIGPKLDSPHLIRWNDELFLFARRSLAFGGNFDVAPRWMPDSVRMRINQGLWSVTRKRSAIYRFDPDTATVTWAMDLPSRGDCSFASIIEDSDGSLIVADYTSPPGSGDPRWIRGQLGETVITATRVTLAT